MTNLFLFLTTTCVSAGLFYDDLIYEEQAACRTAFTFNSECTVKIEYQTEFDPVGEQEELRV
eukprot:snap_masked-scaffold_104-processed-gene-0.7-mRNA-1 protein AED:1.00 eAED:1.00 QI:0/-1/0/0/-1/1/1/0/61